MMSDLVSELVSVRVPTCPLECARLGINKPVFSLGCIRDAMDGSPCAPPMYDTCPGSYLGSISANHLPTAPESLLNSGHQPKSPLRSTAKCRPHDGNRLCPLRATGQPTNSSPSGVLGMSYLLGGVARPGSRAQSRSRPVNS